MINPENIFKQIWSGWILLLTIFMAVEIPLRLCLNYHLDGWVLFLDHLSYLIFGIDVVLNFLTADYIGGQLVTNRKTIARQYLRSWFIFDFLAAFPFELLLAAGSMSTFTTTARVFRLFRLVRLARIAQFVQRLLRSDVINITFLRMLILMFWVLLLSHWAACGWIALGGLADIQVPHERYIRSLYWATTTITTIGYGDISPPATSMILTVYTMFIQLLGAATFGYVIGNIASLLANIDVARAQYMEKMEKINTFMRFRKIPGEIQDQIRNYYSYLWESRRGYDESQVLQDLPQPLEIKISLFLNREIIEKVPLFLGANEDLVRKICLNLNPEVYTPGDFIFRKGEVGHKMYFISRGAVDVVSEDGATIYATLREGNFFGEIALLLSQPRTASIRAVDYCDLYTLDKTTFQGILSDYPEFARQVHEMAALRQVEITGRAMEYSEDENVEPPLPTEGLTVERGESWNLLIWDQNESAAVYQVLRFDPALGRWRIINGFVQSNRYRDRAPLPANENRYRVRAVNQTGMGKWSEVVQC